MENFATLIIVNHRPHRNLDQQIVSVLAVALAPQTMLTPFGVKDAVVPKLNECVVTQGGLQVHMATSPAVASAGPASRDKLLPSKGHATTAPVACLQLDSRLIQKHSIRRSAGLLIVSTKANPLPNGISIQ
jgi:hypothetical protein